jgi:hypothetical protein
VQPTVIRVSGCVDAANITTQCPTEGGVELVIFGANFFQSAISVTVGGQPCSDPRVVSLFEVRCALPPSSGGSLRALLVTSLGQQSNPGFVSYGTHTPYRLPTTKGFRQQGRSFLNCQSLLSCVHSISHDQFDWRMYSHVVRTKRGRLSDERRVCYSA